MASHKKNLRKLYNLLLQTGNYMSARAVRDKWGNAPPEEVAFEVQRLHAIFHDRLDRMHYDKKQRHEPV